MLGPLEATVDGAAVPLGGRRQGAVLAVLLAHANETVPVERLIDGVWDDEPPETAANVLQGYVSQLRKVLGREVIATRGRGYAVSVGSGEIDLDRFEQKAATAMAERTRGSAAAASELLSAALAIWRGPALSDLADLPAAGAARTSADAAIAISATAAEPSRGAHDLPDDRTGPVLVDMRHLLANEMDSPRLAQAAGTTLGNRWTPMGIKDGTLTLAFRLPGAAMAPPAALAR